MQIYIKPPQISLFPAIIATGLVDELKNQAVLEAVELEVEEVAAEEEERKNLRHQLKNWIRNSILI